MNVLQVVLTGLFLSISLALISGCIYLFVKKKQDREAIGVAKAARNFLEVWRCPSCNRLSRIARRCKWCLKEMPSNPKFLTVLEREYIEQLLLPRPETRRDPTDDPSFT